jgi:hypothetical protein
MADPGTEKITSTEQIAALITEIDCVVPESDGAYEEDVLQQRRDYRDNLMYQAADACAFLLDGLDIAHVKLKALGALAETPAAIEAEARQKKLTRVAELALSLVMLGHNDDVLDTTSNECAQLLHELGFVLSRTPRSV